MSLAALNWLDSSRLMKTLFVPSDAVGQALPAAPAAYQDRGRAMDMLFSKILGACSFFLFLVPNFFF